MNQPTDERIDKLEKRVERLERTRGETEPIKVTRIEIENHAEILKDVSTKQEELLQMIYTMVGKSNTDIAVLKHEMQGARADIIAIKATQSDHGEILRDTQRTHWMLR